MKGHTLKTYKIVGDRKVAEKEPGEILSEEDLAGSNIDALIEGGHLAPTSTTKAAKAEPVQE